MTGADGNRLDSDKSQAAARALLRPILRLLFTHGLARQALNAVCDEAYIEAASHSLRQRQLEVSADNVAELSGVSKDYIERSEHWLGAPSKTPASPISALAPLVEAATRVITAWHTDPDFTDTDGDPLPLRPDDQRFLDLIEQCGNGFATSEIGNLLRSTDAVTINEQGEWIPRGRYLLAAPHSADIDHNALEALVDLARAIEINQVKESADTGALQRTCSNERIPLRSVPLFKYMLSENTQAFLEIIDDWLIQHEERDESTGDDEPLVRLGVGVYVIADE